MPYPRPSQQRQVSDFFGSDADDYDTRHYSPNLRTFIADRLATVREELARVGLAAGSTVADVACGPGHFAAIAASDGHKVIAIDQSEDMLRVTARRLGRAAELLRADAAALPLGDDSVDLVNCSGLVEYLPDPTPVLREFFRVLRPGGSALISSTNRFASALWLAPVERWARGSALARRAAELLHLNIPESAWRPRTFKFYFHTALELRQLSQSAGFEVVTMRHYHMQFLPHPVDRVFPRLASWSARAAEPMLRTAAGRALSEGLLAVARKPR